MHRFAQKPHSFQRFSPIQPLDILPFREKKGLWPLNHPVAVAPDDPASAVAEIGKPERIMIKIQSLKF